MKIFVTGGAGYIGSTTAALLLDHDHEVIVFDNLSMGHRAAVPEGAIFILGELANRNEIDRAFKEHRPDAVIHFASRTLVGESMNEPFAYLGDNVCNALNLLESMVEHDVGKIVLSSTANLFDQPESMPISETERVIPGSPYGESKAIIERMLHWLHRTKGMRYGCLRYFNAAGATDIRGEDHTPETHLIPLVLQAAVGQRDEITIFGDDYETPDGTCVRDYVHITDLAQAHLLALDALNSKETVTYNLGNGRGYSIKEVVETARAVTGRPIRAVIGPRRPGDPGTLVADRTKIQRELQWDPSHSDLMTILETAWEWHRRHPDGYES